MPWQQLYENKNDLAFITTMGFDVPMFNTILDIGFKSNGIQHQSLTMTFQLPLSLTSHRDH